MNSVVLRGAIAKVLILSGVLMISGLADQAYAQKRKVKAEDEWITYKNERFGYRLYYPSAIFLPQGEAQAGADDEADYEDEPEDENLEEAENADEADEDDVVGSTGGEQEPAAEGEGDGSTLTLFSADGASKIVVFGALNTEGLSPRQYRTTLLEEFGGYDQLDYQPIGRTWFVLSGFRGDNIYYQKVMFSCANKVVNVFSINFPTSEKATYEPLIEVMEDNFRTGRGEDTPSKC